MVSLPDRKMTEEEGLAATRSHPLIRVMATLAVVTLVLLVLYVASVGPVYGLLSRGYITDPGKRIHHFYDPLRFACENSRLIRAMIDLYLRLFGAN